MRIIIHPVLDPQREIDLTHQLVSAIAEEIWRLFGGNGQLNWLEAELHLQQIVGRARAESRTTGLASIDPPVAASTGVKTPTERPYHPDHSESLMAGQAV